MSAESPPQGRQPKKMKLKCEYCGVTLAVPAKLRDKQISCPNCKHRLRGPKTKATKGEDEAAPVAAKGEAGGKDEKNKALSAWQDFQEECKDNYWVAVLKACLYPYKALGALVFFVVGVPLTVVIVEAVCKAALAWAGKSETMSQPDKLQFFAGGVVLFGLFALLALLSFFCSFLFAVVRTSSEGRRATPVIEGMYHRSNLAAVCAWAAVYFGPGLYLGYASAASDEVFTWSPPVIGLLAVMTLMAPMGFMCSATVTAITGLNLVTVVTGIVKVGKEYAYLLAVVVISSIVFIALGLHVGGMASAEMGQKGSWAVGVLLRMVSSLLFLFPPVVLARSLGLLLQYHQKRLPFAFDFHSEHKGGALPQVVALIGCLALFQPALQEAQVYARSAGRSGVAADHLRDIYKMHLLDNDNRRRQVRSEEELKAVVPAKELRCPGKEGVESMYVVVPNAGYQKETRYFIWIYEREPTDPQGKRVNVLLHNGDVKTLSAKRLAELLELMQRYEGADAEGRRRIRNEYETKLALSF